MEKKKQLLMRILMISNAFQNILEKITKKNKKTLVSIEGYLFTFAIIFLHMNLLHEDLNP